MRRDGLGGSQAMSVDLSKLAWDPNGLIPAIVQQHDTGEVLMVAWMNEESLRKTLESSETWFWSRSRKELWHKGETSGNTQRVTEVRFDCDADTLLVLVDAAGPACHTGEPSCFFRVLGRDEVTAFWEDLGSKPFDPDRTIEGKDRSGRAFTVKAGLIVAQTLNHGNEHRAQIYTILTTIGVQPPDLDGWSYGEATGRFGFAH